MKSVYNTAADVDKGKKGSQPIKRHRPPSTLQAKATLRRGRDTGHELEGLWHDEGHATKVYEDNENDIEKYSSTNKRKNCGSIV